MLLLPQCLIETWGGRQLSSGALVDTSLHRHDMKTLLTLSSRGLRHSVRPLPSAVRFRLSVFRPSLPVCVRDVPHEPHRQLFW